MMANWYRVKTQHNDLAKGDLVLLDGGAREATLEQMGYLEFVSVAQDPNEVPPEMPQVQPKFLAEEPSTAKAATTAKRRTRAQQAEAGQDAGAVFSDEAGESARAGDLPKD